MKASLLARFWRKVRQGVGGDCWTWTAATNNGRRGYGVLWDSASKRQVLAHRVSWEIHNGPIPRGKYVLHSCDVKRCVNPAHLYLGTYSDNLRDSYERGLRKPIALRGESHPSSRLNERIVRQIRSSRSRSAELAARYGVTRGHVTDIRSGRSWAHVK